MKRYALPLLVLFSLLLLLFPSCRKGEMEEEGPVVTVAEDPGVLPVASTEALPEDEVEPSTDAAEEIPLHTSVRAARSVMYVSRSGSIFLKGVFGESEGVISAMNLTRFMMEEMAAVVVEAWPESLGYFTFSMDSDGVVLSYDAELSNDEIASLWAVVSAALEIVASSRSDDVVMDIPISVSHGSVSTLVTLPSVVTVSDVEGFLSYVEEKGLESSSSFTVTDEGVVFTHGEGQGRDAWKEIRESLESYIGSRMEENVEETAAVPEIVPVEEKPEASVVEVKGSDGAFSVLSSPASRLISDFSLSVSGTLKMAGAKGGVFTVSSDVTVAHLFRLGVSIGYDTASYIPLSIRASFPLENVDGLYFAFDLGGRIGLGDNASALLMGAAIGYEYAISPRFGIFAEGGVKVLGGKNPRFEPFVTMGGRYTF